MTEDQLSHSILQVKQALNQLKKCYDDLAESSELLLVVKSKNVLVSLLNNQWREFVPYYHPAELLA